jgi:WD40 repeat protein
MQKATRRRGVILSPQGQQKLSLARDKQKFRRILASGSQDETIKLWDVNYEFLTSGGDNPLKRLIELAFHPVESSKNISLLTGLLQMSFELPYSR